MSKALATEFFIHKAIACPVEMKNPNNKNYNSTGEFALVNGIKGTKTMAMETGKVLMATT